MNFSSNNRFQRNQFNKVVNDYNNISKILNESKNRYLSGNPPSSFNTNSFKYFNKNNYYNNPYNDSDLQNRITNSLYANKNKIINTNIYTPSSMATKSNRSMNTNYLLNNNLNKLPYNNIIEDFKTTLMKTQSLTNKIMSNNNFKNLNNYNYNNYNLNKYNNDIDLSGNSSDQSINSEENDSSLNLDDISEELKYIENNNNEFKYKYTFKNNNNTNINANNINNNNLNNKKDIINIIDNKKEEENDLKKSNQNLKKSNQDLRNENRKLEVEIINYKTKENNPKENKNISTHFDENLQKFITSVKQSFKESINKNLDTMDKIFNFQTENQEISKKNQKLIDEHGKIAGKIEEDNRKNAEIQIMNEENEKKISNLNDEKNNLNSEIEKMKLDLINLQNKEKNLKILNESNIKRKKDNDELLNKLKNTINQLNEEKSSTKEKTSSTVFPKERSSPLNISNLSTKLVSIVKILPIVSNKATLLSLVSAKVATEILFSST